jgi:putative transposase
MSDEKPMGQVIQIDEARIRDHLGEMVRGTVEETLNAMLDAEADQLCGAGRYVRSQARQDTRAGSYSYGGRRLRQRSSNATAAGRARSRKR